MNIFKSRESSISQTGSVIIRILWTNTSGWPDRSKEFVVNHFVPLLKWSDATETMKKTSGKKELLKKMKAVGRLLLAKGTWKKKT